MSYIKPGKTFVLSKKAKTLIALSGGNKESRDQFKRMMIQAELAAAIVPKTEKRDRSAPRGTANYQTNDTGTAATGV